MVLNIEFCFSSWEISFSISPVTSTGINLCSLIKPLINLYPVNVPSLFIPISVVSNVPLLSLYIYPPFADINAILLIKIIYIVLKTNSFPIVINSSNSRWYFFNLIFVLRIKLFVSSASGTPYCFPPHSYSFV